jgi:hypothetical protein
MYVGTYTAHPLTFYTADAPRMAITPAGNVGIGTTAPNYPLNFAATLGDKISLWDSGLGNHYGFGVQANQLQIHADSSSSDIVFGTGRSTNLAETMRIKGNGKVGIGTASVPRSGVGAAMLALGGSASSLAGPHLQYTVLSDDYPVFQQLNWSHDNISQCFDAYYDGVNWRSSSPNSSFQIYKLGSQLSFSTATATAGSVISWVPAMTLSSSGNIGIGTTTPNNKLHVLGNATIGTGSSAAALTLDDTSNAKWRLNTSGFKLAFENDNGGSFASKMVIQNNGNVGIGTTTPTKGSLEIDSGNGSDPQYSPAGFLNTGGAGSGTFGGTSFGSIWAVGAVFGNTFVAFSDERIKNVKSQSDSATDLKTLCGIQITDFTYKDAIAKGNRPQKKVIAQQVEQVFPQAVTTNTDVVPDIYQKATINNGWVQLATDLKVGDRVKLIGEKEKGVYAVLELREGAFRTDFKPGSESVFVYGREVKDFRNVDYEAIAMLNVSATQELARRLKSQQESLTRLQGNLDQAMADKEALLSRLSVLEERDQACEARLARMERALEKGSATGSHVSLNRVNGGAQ